MNRSQWPGLLFDTHCHLHFDDFRPDLEAVVGRAFDAGVRGILVPSIDLASSIRSSSLARDFGLWSAAGFHPNHLEGASDPAFKEVAGLSLLPQAAAVGETGLDFYRDRFPREVQTHWFRKHIDLSADLALPLVVHSRGAEGAVLDCLPQDPGFPVILHSWCGSGDITSRAVKRGFYFGITGAVTYRKSEIARNLGLIPREMILAETDAPFLTPVPHRGGRNEPALTTLTAGRIALEWNLSVSEALEILWGNSLRAFRLSPGSRRTHLVYPMSGKLYVNITGKCNSSCGFCIRSRQDGLGGYNLRHRIEPSREAVLSALSVTDPAGYDEVVFCGYGEPTMRPDLLCESAEQARSGGGRTRLNTNGLCLGHMNQKEAETMLGRFDRVSISLNASGAAEYSRVCPGASDCGWENLMGFIRMVKRLSIPAVLTAVEGSGADIPKVRALAERLELPVLIREGQ
ncbi:MAG: TatD family hydrolase [Candidatus Fermentibacteraceae bacterium]